MRLLPPLGSAFHLLLAQQRGCMGFLEGCLSGHKIRRLLVYDPTGRQVSRIYTESEITEVEVPSVVGVYMIRLNDRENGNSWTEKIIVK